MNVLGIDLGGTNLRAGLVKHGALATVSSIQIQQDGSHEAVVQQIFSLVDSFGQGHVDGIGIGVPGVVDVARGIVYDVVNMPAWREVPLKDLLQKRYRLPVFVNNDANCFAVGEKFFGKGKACSDMVGLIVGTGLGAGLIIHDSLYTGRNCGAGEFGMIPYLDGVLENYSSGQFFKKVGMKSGKELFREALDGDSQAKDAFQEFGRHLGYAIAIILLAMDPELIVLGGSVSKAFPFFRDAMWKSLASFPYARTIQNIHIEASEVENIAILGAAALFYDATREAPASLESGQQ